DVVGQVEVRIGDLVGNDGADAGIDDAADTLAVAGVHQVVSRAVVGIAGGHAAQDGHVLHLLSELGQVLADLDAGHAGIDELVLATVFDIPGVRLGGAAVHPEEDAGLVLGAGRGLFSGAAGQRLEPAGHRGPDHAGGGQPQHIAAVHFVRFIF